MEAVLATLQNDICCLTVFRASPDPTRTTSWIRAPHGEILEGGRKVRNVKIYQIIIIIDIEYGSFTSRSARNHSLKCQ